ncbi:MAG: tripartite tricarboxylate transporter substrate binding protein [Pseudomonadota bacterium]
MHSTLRALLAASLLLGASFSANADDFPSKSLTFVVPYAAGGPTDVVARMVANAMSASIKQSIVVQNMPGADGVVALQKMATEKPDGYTIAIPSNSAVTYNPFIYKKIPTNPMRDLAPITMLVSSDVVLVTRPDYAAKTVPELIALAGKSPKSVKFGNSTSGTQVVISLLASKSGADFLVVPYKGAAPALTALLSGEVDLLALPVSAAKALAEGGKIRMLALTGPRRSSSLPSVPAVAEHLPGFSVAGWFAAMVPAATPKDRIDVLYRHFVTALNTPSVKSALEAQTYKVEGMPPDEFARLIKEDSEKFGKIIRDFNITVE